ncbi:MAG: MFS transporter, partial [Tepidiformaceae bacterium]
RNVRLLYLYWFLRDFQLWIPVWIVFLTVQRGFSLTQVTGAEGLFLVGVLLLEVPTGAVADRWGRSRSMGLGVLFLGVSILIFAFTNTFGVLLASFMLWSVASTLMSGADMALLYDTLKASGDEGAYERVAGRGHAFSWAGAGIATFLGGPAAALTDIRATILFGAATCLLTAFVAFSMWEPGHEQAEEDEAPEHYLQSIRAAFAEVWRNAEVRAIVLLTGTAFAAMGSVDYLMQPYLIDRGVEIGVLFSMLQVPTFIIGIAGGLLASRLRGRGRTLMLVLPAIGAGAYLSLVLGPGLSAYAAFPLMSGLAALLLPLATGQINRRIDSKRRATVLSMHGMVASLLMAALAPGLGFATDNWGLAAAFGVGGVATVASLVLFGPMLLSKTAAAGPSGSVAARADV